MEMKCNIFKHTADLIVFRLSNTNTNNFINWKDIFKIFTNKIFIHSFINILSKKKSIL